MHELSLAQGVMEILVEEARRHRIGRIERVRLRVGALRAVVPELLQTGMEFVSQGTPAEGAQVTIEEVPGQARCRSCGLQFEVSDPWIVCPGCEQVGGEILAGRELQIIDFEGD